jgi:hypothetical protein
METKPQSRSVGSTGENWGNVDRTGGMAGVIAIHEMLHVLGLPEGGPGQMTSQQITDSVSSACGTT